MYKRQDKDSEGLLLMTNDGDFANTLMHPANHIGKTYRVTVRPGISEDQLVKLSSGVLLDDGYTTQPAQVHVLDQQPGRVVLQLSLIHISPAGNSPDSCWNTRPAVRRRHSWVPRAGWAVCLPDSPCRWMWTSPTGSVTPRHCSLPVSYTHLLTLLDENED